ncbi:MAG: ABC transporter substrate-binding protein [Rhodospirillaceae bacterium]|nr:ABC transporter substrate-binding protein [Rhodospirillaceae bacterium]
MMAAGILRFGSRFLAAILLAGCLAGEANAKPQRIVSLNLCTDQLVLMLAKAPNIAAVSYLSHDPVNSYMASVARDFPATYGRAEEILSLEPDLILAGRFTSQGSVAFLKRTGYRVVILDLPEDFPGIRAQIRHLAAVLEEEERGNALLSDMDRRLERAKLTASADQRTAAFYLPNGYTAGSGTSVHSILTAAGFRNKVAELGVTGTVVLPMERLMVSNPEVLILSSFGDGGGWIAEEGLRHPAFARLMKGKTLIRIPTRLWVCPGPMLAEAVELLMEARP